MSARPRGFIADYKPRADTAALIERVLAVLVEYEDYLPLTIRQVFYRLIATGEGYEKSERAYKRLIELLGKARRGGLIRFEHIRDDGAVRDNPFGYDGVDDVLATFEAITSGYRLNRQIGQPMFTLLACEAGGMVPQMVRVAEPFGVPVLSGGGFDSVSVKYDLGREVARSERLVRLLHVGDYDPSGVHLFTSLMEDIRAFARDLNPRAQFEAVRVAILPEHVAAYGLQTAPKKATDNRSFEGVDGDADGTVQAEALDPADLAALVESALRRGWDEEAAARLEERESEERARVQAWLERSLARSRP
jgi:hypothetical protein